MTADHPVRPWYVCNGDPCRCPKPKTRAPELSPEEAARVAVFDAAEEPEEVTVERMARAICEADFDVDGRRWSWDDADRPAREDYRRMARAALAALRGDRGE